MLEKEEVREKKYLDQFINNLISFDSIPFRYRNEEICSIAIKQNAEAIKAIPLFSLNETLCLLAMPEDGLLLEYVPADLRNYNVCSAAIKQNALALQYVVSLDVLSHAEYEELCLSALEQNAQALQYVLPEFLTYDRCLMAVAKNPIALKYVPDNFKEQIISTLTPKSLLENNYFLINFFPEKIRKELKQTFLRGIKNIAINSNPSDHELKDAELIFAEKRKDKIIHVNSNIIENLNAILEDLRKANNEENDVRLIFFGHTSEGSEFISGLHYQNIVDLCEIYPNINHIQLIGCNVAKAKQTKKEKEMMQNYTEKEANLNMKYGLVSTADASFDNQSLQEKYIDFCKKRNLNGIYILNKIEQTNYQLQVVKYDNQYTEATTQKMISIPDNRFKNNTFFGLNKNKAITFPKEKGILLTVNEKLTDNELKSVRAIKYKEDRFHSAHPNYRKDKEKIPFLAKIEAEVSDLKPSLHKIITNAIERNPNITRDITIQGFTKAIYVDTEARQFIGSKKYLYENYHDSCFKSKKPNINKKRLESEQKLKIKEMKQGGEGEETMANQLITTVKKGPH